jgi:CRP-like cAMP-binding protein
MSKVDHKVWMESAIGREFTEAEAREIHYICRREEYGEGEKLFVEGNPAVEIFLIVEGEVDVVKKGFEGRPTTLATLGPGAILGEMSLLMQDQRSASAVTRTAAMVLRVEWEHFQKLLKNEPQVAFKVVNGLARLLATRLKRINAKVAELTTLDEPLQDGQRIEEFASFKKKLMSDWSF